MRTGGAAGKIPVASAAARDYKERQGGPARSGQGNAMRRTLTALSFAASLLFACRGEAEAPTDPKALYRLDAKAEPATVQAGGKGTFRLAVRPTREGAHVKAETPFRGTLEATGPLALEKTALSYEDHARVEEGGPVFEIPFAAKEAGKGELKADLVFFVCTDEACMRTTEEVRVPVEVR